MEILLYITVPAQIDFIENAVQLIRNQAKKFGFNEKKLKDIELVSEEAIVNIVSYAYSNNKGEIEIQCHDKNNEQFIITIIDSGTPFDIRQLPPPEFETDIDNCRVGGLGIYLIKMVADDLNYKRENNKNHLSITFVKDKSH